MKNKKDIHEAMKRFRMEVLHDKSIRVQRAFKKLEGIV